MQEGRSGRTTVKCAMWTCSHVRARFKCRRSPSSQQNTLSGHNANTIWARQPNHRTIRTLLQYVRMPNTRSRRYDGIPHCLGTIGGELTGTKVQILGRTEYCVSTAGRASGWVAPLCGVALPKGPPLPPWRRHVNPLTAHAGWKQALHGL